MNSKEARERMNSGRLYPPGDQEIRKEQTECLELLYDYNRTRPGEREKRRELLKKMFGFIGEGCYIEPPLHSNWGGRHVYMGKGTYANFGLTLVDDGEIRIGEDCMFGPNVTIATAGHPIDPDLRRTGAQYNLSVVIGNNVWVGAGAVILPGVEIGDNTVIGAGSVVTKNIPSGVVAVGNPCRILRPVGERDKEYYYKERTVDTTVRELAQGLEEEGEYSCLEEFLDGKDYAEKLRILRKRKTQFTAAQLAAICDMLEVGTREREMSAQYRAIEIYLETQHRYDGSRLRR